MLLAGTSGLLLSAAFPKPQLAWLAWLAWLPLLAALRDAGARQGFRLGFAAGLAHGLTLVYWVVPTMQTYGGLPLYLAVPILVLLAAYLALYWALFGMALPWSCRRPARLLWLAPVLWTGLEYLRGQLFTGFPWMLSGYSQVGILPLLQISDIFGIYGVSALLVAMNAALFIGALQLTGQRWQAEGVGRRLAAGAAGAAAALVAASAGYGLWRMAQIDRLSAGAESVQLAAVQGSIDQGVKWDPAFRDRTIDTYLRLSSQAASEARDLIVWPETAAPFYLLREREPTRRLLAGVRLIGRDAIVGSPAMETGAAAESLYYNSAYLATADGRLRRYDKAHLVPFGEYVPLKRFFPFVGKIVPQVGDFEPGRIGVVMPWRGGALGVQICYEIIFPELARAQVNHGADLLINITNDAWYGRSSAPYQHFAMSVVRAVENRRSLLRSANTGISGVIDPVGRVLAATELFTEAVVGARVPRLTHHSVYTRYGDLFAHGCLLAAAGGLLLGARRRRGRRSPGADPPPARGEATKKE
jgi:apolipoprotein N-acyltransferase